MKNKISAIATASMGIAFLSVAQAWSIEDAKLCAAWTAREKVLHQRRSAPSLNKSTELTDESALSRISKEISALQEQTRVILEWDAILKNNEIQVVANRDTPAFVDAILKLVKPGDTRDNVGFVICDNHLLFYRSPRTSDQENDPYGDAAVKNALERFLGSLNAEQRTLFLKDPATFLDQHKTGPDSPLK